MDFDEVSQNENNEDQNQLDEILFLDQDQISSQYISLKDCVIFLLDCSKSMHKIQNNLKTTGITSVLTVAEDFLKTKIITNEKDLFGLVLFNTSLTKNEMNFEGVNQLIDITPPDANLIKKIQNYEQMTNPILIPDDYENNLKENFPYFEKNTKSFLSNALWICHSMLKSYDKKNFNRRIFLFTDNDNPEFFDLNEKNLIFQRAKDMLDSDIIIELFPMNFSDRFNLQKFYKNIIPANIDDEENNNDNILNIEQCADRLRELTRRIRQKEIKKRTLGKCPFYLTNNTKIYMNIYSTIKRANKGRAFNIDAKSNKLLNSKNIITCKDTGTNLYPNQIGTYELYGNKKIKFSKEEMSKIKTLDSPGIKLLGFKSINSIKPYYNIRESYFIYPNENISNGSGQLCDALIKQMSNKNKCAIVKFIGREGSNIKICALIPQKESFDEDYFQTPPGFNMIILPYADDIRSNSDIMNKMIKVDESNNEESEIAKKLIKKMNISFDCRNFENVSLQKFYATLQALALEEKETENIDDLIQPDNDALEKVLQGCDENFRKIFYGDNYESDLNEKYYKGKKKVKGEKRSNSKSRSQSKDVKKNKSKGSKKKNNIIDESNDMEIENEEEDYASINDQKLRKLFSDGKLSKLKVNELKQICNGRNIVTKKKKKNDIIDSIEEYLNNN